MRIGYIYVAIFCKSVALRSSVPTYSIYIGKIWTFDFIAILLSTPRKGVTIEDYIQ